MQKCFFLFCFFEEKLSYKGVTTSSHNAKSYRGYIEIVGEDKLRKRSFIKQNFSSAKECARKVQHHARYLKNNNINIIGEGWGQVIHLDVRIFFSFNLFAFDVVGISLTLFPPIVFCHFSDNMRPFYR